MLAGCSAGTNDNASGSGKDKKVLVMGTSADYPPFEYVKTEKAMK